MIAVIVFMFFFLLALTLYLKRNTFIDGINANSRIKEVRALAYWEGMIVEAKTAQEKMAYMRLADEIKGKLIDDVNREIANESIAVPIFKGKKSNADVNKIVSESDNVVSLAKRRKAGS